jgi:hypothetical protein
MYFISRKKRKGKKGNGAVENRKRLIRRRRR